MKKCNNYKIDDFIRLYLASTSVGRPPSPLH